MACGGLWGTQGVAWVNTLCYKGRSTGVNKIHTRSPWETFAHELGHNFGGKHSFEDGRGKTGGLMDYGDGKLNGHYQFNTKYRKQEMCRQLDRVESWTTVMESCRGITSSTQSTESR